MLPMPMADPAAARINPMFELHFPREAMNALLEQQF
jgi:hypothetical protein